MKRRERDKVLSLENPDSHQNKTEITIQLLDI